MIIFRYELLAMVVLASKPVSSRVAQQYVSSCGNIEPSLERACVGRRIDGKERELAAAYARAVSAVRRNFARYGAEDSRSSVSYLVRSQVAWKRFVDNDCTVQAAFGGGSNSSISERETDCYEDALDKRLEFLGQLADGSFGTG